MSMTTRPASDSAGSSQFGDIVRGVFTPVLAKCSKSFTLAKKFLSS
jgi:hypothetical protein